MLRILKITFIFIAVSNIALAQDTICNTITAYQINENRDTVEIVKQWVDNYGNILKSSTTTFQEMYPKSWTFTRWHILNQEKQDSITYSASIASKFGFGTHYNTYNQQGRIIRKIIARPNSKRSDTIDYHYSFKRDSSTMEFYTQRDGSTYDGGHEEYTDRGIIRKRYLRVGRGCLFTFYDTIANRILYEEHHDVCGPPQITIGEFPVLFNVIKYRYNSKNKLVSKTNIPKKAKTCEDPPGNPKFRKVTYKYNRYGQVKVEKTKGPKGTSRIKYEYGKEVLHWESQADILNLFNSKNFK